MDNSSTSNPTVTKQRSLKPITTKIFGLIAITIILTALYCKTPSKIDDNDCYSEFSNGQWASQRWYPYQCIINRYPTKNYLLNCLKDRSQTRMRVQFIGDALLSKYFRSLVSQFVPSGQYDLPNDLENSSPIIYTNDNGLGIEFAYSPLLGYQLMHQYRYQDKDSIPQLVIMSFNGFDGDPSKHTCYSMGDKLIKYQTSFIEKFQEEDMATPIVLMFFQDLETEHDRECQKIVKAAYDEASVVNALVRNSIVILEMNESSPLQGMETIVHFMCNSATDSTCCISSSSTYYRSITLPFLLLCLALYMGLVLLRATGTLLPLEPYLEAGKIDLDKTYVIINMVGSCVIAALFICSAEKLDSFSQASVWRSPLLMVLFSIAVFCLGFLKTVKITQGSGFLCKEQLLEWRGWTVLLMVALEYTRMAETGLGFWLWQFLVSCYCFTCAYSHFVWFCANSDYTFTRVIKVIVKQNYFLLVIMVTVFPPVSIYTIPLVNTIAFLLVYLIMSLPPKLAQPDAVKGVHTSTGGFLVKLIAVTILIIVETVIELYAVPSTNSLFLSPNPKASLVTFYSTRMMVLLGITVGYYTVYVAGSNDLQTFISHRVQGLIILLAFGVYISFLVLARPMMFFESWHLLLVGFPILAYCMLRNWNDLLKSSYSLILNYTGEMSVEFYVISRHTLLTHAGHGLLYLFPSYYAVNMLCTLFLTVLLSLAVTYNAVSFGKKVLNSTNKVEVVTVNGDEQIP